MQKNHSENVGTRVKKKICNQANSYFSFKFTSRPHQVIRPSDVLITCNTTFVNMPLTASMAVFQTNSAESLQQMLPSC